MGLDKNTFVFWTTDTGAWQNVHSDAGYTPFRGTKGTVGEGGSRVPAIAWMPEKIEAHSRNYDVLGGLDFMATFAALAGLDLPAKDLANEPTIFDSYDMSPALFGKGKSKRKAWFYFVDDELGAVRLGSYKAVFASRGREGVPALAAVPQIFDLWQDPQERYDFFTDGSTERTWTMIEFDAAIKELMATYIQYPPRTLQRIGYARPAASKERINIPIPAGN